MIALSPALATLLMVAQVSTSSVTCTPKACFDWREAYYTEHGTTLKFQEEGWRLGGDLADCEGQLADREQEVLQPRECPGCPTPVWSGWPWVGLGVGAVIGIIATLAIQRASAVVP